MRKKWSFLEVAIAGLVLLILMNVVNKKKKNENWELFKTLVLVLQWLNDIWTFDLDELVWQQVNPLSELAPKPRGKRSQQQKKEIL